MKMYCIKRLSSNLTKKIDKKENTGKTFLRDIGAALRHILGDMAAENCVIPRFFRGKENPASSQPYEDQLEVR